MPETGFIPRGAVFESGEILRETGCAAFIVYIYTFSEFFY